MRIFWGLVFCLSLSIPLSAQKRPPFPSGSDSLPKKSKQKKKQERPPIGIQDYKIVSFARDTTFVDTTLTLKKDYKYNYLRKDNFELLPFSNVGQTYNRLSYVGHSDVLYPNFGASAKHNNFFERRHIKYYNVPTPTTELFFKTTFEQGQLLDAFLTGNTSKRFNFSIAYKGMRSLGKYQHILSSTGNFRTTANYTTQNGQYQIRAHIVHQDILNEENGGIANRAQFESGDEQFTDRSRIDVVYQDAENLLVGKRYYFDHYYLLTKSSDSLTKNQLGLFHSFDYESKFYEFKKTNSGDLYGAAFDGSGINDKASLKAFYNRAGVQFKNNILGSIRAQVNSYNYNYFFNSILITPTASIPSRLKGDELAFGGAWEKGFGKFLLKGKFNTNLSGTLGGNRFEATAKWRQDKFKAEATAFSSSRMPAFNFLLYQSDYTNYNWRNDNFLLEKNKGLTLKLGHNKWGNLEVSYKILDNYTHFISNNPSDSNPEAFLVPRQAGASINYLKVKFNNKIEYRKFALHNTFMFQDVEQNSDVLNLPQWVMRNTLVFSSYVFKKKPMFLQAGINFKTFSGYYANSYNPVLGEFYVQNQEKIGDFPLIDVFINAKVRQTRIYLKAEHINSSFTGYTFYSAPGYPYRDFVIRFGLAWNFFS